MRQLLIPFCLIFSFISACALSPQVIEVSPVLDYENATMADRQNPISIQVTDARQDGVLGSRGGVYSDTALLTSNPGMISNIRNALVDAFTALGYQVSENSNQASLTVMVSELSYSNQKSTALNNITTRAAVKVTCRNQRSTMNNDYAITDQKEFVKLPSENVNTNLVNTTLGSTLNRMFQDQTLFSCLDNQPVN